jgi:hypothetical protein
MSSASLNLARDKDPKISAKAVELWLKYGAPAYGRQGTMAPPQQEARPQTFIEQICQDSLADMTETRERMDKVRARKGLPPISDQEFVLEYERELQGIRDRELARAAQRAAAAEAEVPARREGFAAATVEPHANISEDCRDGLAAEPRFASASAASASTALASAVSAVGAMLVLLMFLAAWGAGRSSGDIKEARASILAIHEAEKTKAVAYPWRGASDQFAHGPLVASRNEAGSEFAATEVTNRSMASALDTDQCRTVPVRSYDNSYSKAPAWSDIPMYRLCTLMTMSICSAALAAEPPAYRVLAADKGRVAIVDADGKVEWEVANKAEVHDLALLDNGNILMPTSRTTVVEMSPDKKVVWKYEAKPKAGYKGGIEIHAFQRLADGKTMIAESGNGRIVEVDKDGKVVFEMPLTIDKPNAHRDTRMARKLDTGNYLVCHEGDGKVREYEPTGKVVWSYTLDLGGRPRSPGHGPEGHGNEVYGAVRLKNGNTLIGTGNGNRVLEVNREGKTVWELKQDELSGIKLAWVTMLQVKEDGNIIVGNCHAGPDNPQLFEVTRDKKVVWQFKNFKTFGNGLAAAQVLGIKGKVVR